MKASLTWTKKPESTLRLSPGEWNGYRVGKRVELRARIGVANASLVIRIEDLRYELQENGRRSWKYRYKLKLAHRMTQRGENFTITFGISGTFTISQDDLKTINEMIGLGIERLERDWAEYNA